MLLAYSCQVVLSVSTELNDSHFIEWDKHYLSYVIDLDDYVSIRFLSRISSKIMFYDITDLYVRIILSLKKNCRESYY